jgi:hypothetical protein
VRRKNPKKLHHVPTWNKVPWPEKKSMFSPSLSCSILELIKPSTWTTFDIKRKRWCHQTLLKHLWKVSNLACCLQQSILVFATSNATESKKGRTWLLKKIARFASFISMFHKTLQLVVDKNWQHFRITCNNTKTNLQKAWNQNGRLLNQVCPLPWAYYCLEQT